MERRQQMDHKWLSFSQWQNQSSVMSINMQFVQVLSDFNEQYKTHYIYQFWKKNSKNRRSTAIVYHFKKCFLDWRIM